MGERLTAIRVSITRHIGDEPQPGIIECEFTDARGRRHSFVEKTAIVTADNIDSTTRYPRPGVIACEIVGRHLDESGREFMIVDTERPWGVESSDGLTRFEVAPSQLVEYERGSGIESV